MIDTVTLENKLSLVTGACGVVGLATSRALLAMGVKVVLVDLDPASLDRLAEDLGPGAIPVALDISDSEAVHATCGRIREQHGPVQILVNNAGVLSNNKAVATSADEWRRILEINLGGAFYLSREWLDGMKSNGWGRIINVCSLGMKTGGLTAGTAYAASKGGMGALTFSLARESAPFGVTVNGIAPAYVNTPMVTEQLTEDQRKQLLATIPVGRFCEGEEVAQLICYLASPMTGFITGEIVDINGGLHMD